MIKRITIFLLLLSALYYLWGCDSYNTDNGVSSQNTPKSEETEPTPIDQNNSDYIIHFDWMTFYFSKKDFKKSDIADITTEAISIMADIRSYLKVNYTLEEAKETVCYFDSTYRNEEGHNRSCCLWSEKRMYCISLDDFIHEYVHIISENNAELVYHPTKLFSEGLAQYVSLNFYDGIASQNYVFFKEQAVSENSNTSEHQIICDLLSNNELTYDAENYNKAIVAILDKNYDVSKIDNNSDFYKYYIGHVFVDYCINQLGGLKKFIAVYCDSVTIVDIYGKSIDELVMEACAYNTSMFF